MYKHTDTLCIIGEKEQSFQVSTVKVVEGKQNYKINKITLLWKKKKPRKKIDVLG